MESEGAAAVATPKPSTEGGEGEEDEETVIVNVSGINPELWSPQEFGEAPCGAHLFNVL